MIHHSYVYFLTNWNNKVMYVGVTNDLERRLSEHKQKIVRGFTQRYNATKLVYYETYTNIEDAIRREKEIKGWKRFKKNALVNETNPNWKDLSEDWYIFLRHPERSEGS